ncbi:hypothetical protein P9139_04170 [Curtobacterium flaccumfaciens]|nr:hypothetical protein P9139_04170 [Curtobacterium flaccumfaciens]
MNLRDDILDGVFDEAALAIYEAARDSALLDIDEVAAAGNKTTPLEAKAFELLGRSRRCQRRRAARRAVQAGRQRGQEAWRPPTRA